MEKSNKIKHVSFKDKGNSNNAIDFIETLLEKIKNDEISCLGMFYLADNEEHDYETYYLTKNGRLELLGLIDVLKDSVIQNLLECE